MRRLDGEADLYGIDSCAGKEEVGTSSSGLYAVRSLSTGCRCRDQRSGRALYVSGHASEGWMDRLAETLETG